MVTVVQKHWTGELFTEHSPAYESQSNGEIEKANQTIQGRARTLKESLAIKSGYVIPDDSPLLAWLIEHCANLHNFYRKDTDGYTPFQRIKGRTWNIALPEFGERVEYLSRHESRWKPRWYPGIFVGINPESTAKFIATPGGVVTSRSVRLKPG